MGARINWSHPLSQDLVAALFFNEQGGGQLSDLASMQVATISVPSTPWASDPSGWAVHPNDSSNGNNVSEAMGKFGPPLTIFMIFRYPSVAVGNSQALFSYDDGTQNNGIYIRLGAAVNPSPIFGIFGAGGSENSFSTLVFNSASTVYALAVTLDKNAGTSVAYLCGNGTLIGSQSVAEASTVTGSPKILRIGWALTHTNDFYVSQLLLYNRVLSQNEVVTLANNPSAMLIPQSPTKWWLTAPAAVAATTRPFRTLLGVGQ